MNTRRLVEKISLALKEIGLSEDVEIDFTCQNQSSSSLLGLKMSVSIKDKLDKVRQDSLDSILSQKFGFTRNIIGLYFKSGKYNYVVKEFAPKNRKYPIIALNLENNMTYKFSSKSIKFAMGGDQGINRYFNLENLTKNE